MIEPTQPVRQIHMLNRHDLAAYAAHTMRDEKWVVLDTETTGLPGEVIEIAIVNHKGEILINQRIKPTIPIPTEATAIHGIADEDVWACPSFAEVWPKMLSIFQGVDFIVTYNATFDAQCIELSAKAHGITMPQLRWFCLMRSYAQWHGGKNGRWQKLIDACAQQGVILEGAHGALADAMATYNLIRALAAKVDKWKAEHTIDIDKLTMKKGRIEL